MTPSELPILVFEANTYMRKLLVRMLSRVRGTTVRASESGAGVAEWLSAQHRTHDLILLEMRMPETQGVQFARMLVEHRYGGGVIVVNGGDKQALAIVRNVMHAHHRAGPLMPGEPTDEASPPGWTEAGDMWRQAQIDRRTMRGPWVS